MTYLVGTNNNIVVFCDDTSNRAVGILQVYPTLRKNLGQNIVIFCDKIKTKQLSLCRESQSKFNLSNRNTIN